MRLRWAVGLVGVVALGAIALGSGRAPAIDPEARTLLLSILDESDAYDAEHLSCYSIEYTSRSETRDSKGGMAATQSRDGKATVCGEFVALEEVTIPQQWSGGTVDTRPRFHQRTATDGELVISHHQAEHRGSSYRRGADGVMTEVVSTGPRLLRPETQIRPDRRGLRRGVATPLPWMSLGENWPGQSPGAPLRELLQGGWVAHTLKRVGHGGKDVKMKARIEELSVRSETVDGERVYRVRIVIRRRALPLSHVVGVEYLLAVDKALRPIQISNWREGDPASHTVDELTVGQSLDGVWHPTGLRRNPFAHTRIVGLKRPDEVRKGEEPGIRADEPGSQERFAEFSNFRKNPTIPEDLRVAIPAPGSAARAAILSEGSGEARTRRLD
jgi:hypothetical protein